ncbi:MAG: CvpA family protein [Deltaproteobacteria bacterium]|nr:CvpA family protein [Candidatus Anaeroferrophillus wilburensis]MBN2888246.1 CvpA family protein [Deltaproteobacteria bacterium]
MNTLDSFIIIVILVSVLMGFYKGFFAEMVALVGLLVSIVLASRYYQVLAPHLEDFITIKPLASFISFMLILFATMLAFSVLRMAIKKATIQMEMGWADHLLGLLLGLVKGLFFSSIVVLMIISVWGGDIRLIRGSQAVPIISKFSQITAGLLPDTLKKSIIRQFQDK